MDTLVLGGQSFTSRLVVGTGKYKDFPTMKAALGASGAQIVTVAVRRLDLQAKGANVASARERNPNPFSLRGL